MTVSRPAPLPVATVVVMVVAAAGLAVLWAGVATGTMLAAVDPAVDARVAATRPAWLVEAARIASTVGTPAVMIALLVVVSVVLARRTGSWTPVWTSATAIVLLTVFDHGVSAIVARPRPPLALRAMSAQGLSFPSGHALWSAGVLLLVVLLTSRRPAVVVPAVVVAVIVAGSRVVLTVHYPSDVLAGWCLAVLADLLAIALVAAVVTRRTSPVLSPS